MVVPRPRRPSRLRRLAHGGESATLSWGLVASVAVHAVALGGLAWVALEDGRRPARSVFAASIAPAPQPPPEFAPEPRAEPEFEREWPQEPEIIEQELPPATLQPSPLDPHLESELEDSLVKAKHIAVRWAGARRAEAGGSSAPAGEVQAPGEAAPAAPPPLEPAPQAPQPPVLVPPRIVERVEPQYPRLSRRLEEAGTVTVRIFVSEAGTVTQVEITESSGSTRLDEAAREAVLQWRFAPATRDGTPTSATVIHRITFQLEDAG